MPYNYLINDSMKGLIPSIEKLSNKIIIFDEAHNIV